jgi:hypothetical protein
MATVQKAGLIGLAGLFSGNLLLSQGESAGIPALAEELLLRMGCPWHPLALGLGESFAFFWHWRWIPPASSPTKHFRSGR